MLRSLISSWMFTITEYRLNTAMTCTKRDENRLRRWQISSKEGSRSSPPFPPVKHPATRQTSLGFPYLKISDKPAKVLRASSTETVKPLSKKISRFVNSVFIVAGVMAIGLSLALSNVSSKKISSSLWPILIYHIVYLFNIISREDTGLSPNKWFFSITSNHTELFCLYLWNYSIYVMFSSFQNRYKIPK